MSNTKNQRNKIKILDNNNNNFKFNRENQKRLLEVVI
jgi:hypothetical protein